jgi:hypothetical protein
MRNVYSSLVVNYEGGNCCGGLGLDRWLMVKYRQNLPFKDEN